jgi:hypothetical protein
MNRTTLSALMDAADALDVASRKLREVITAEKEKDVAPTPAALRGDLAPYVAPTPEGYDTILGYLAKRGIDADDLGRYDSFELMRVANRKGIERPVVEAPAALKAVGIETVRSYPIWMLDAHVWRDPAVNSAVDTANRLINAGLFQLPVNAALQ